MISLFEGYDRFLRSYWQEHQARYAELARDGQSPSTMVIACSDSRVSPELIFDAAPGEIFVVRNVSNLVPPYAPDTGNHGTSAALEFAVTGLKVTRIVVLGHSQCGGIRALMQGSTAPAPAGDFIASWMKIAEAAREKICEAAEPEADFDALCERCGRESIRISLRNLLSFPWIRTRVEEGSLKLAGLVFNVRNAALETIDLAPV